MANLISLVSYPFLPAKMGGQKGIALFYKYFSRYHRVVCVTTKNNDASAAEGYEVLNILSDAPIRYINPFYFFTLRRMIRREHASHLILEHPYYGWLGVLLKRFCGVQLVIHSHNLEGLRWKNLGKWWWRVLWAYEKWAHRHADWNFFIQDEDRQYAIDRFSLDPAKCITMTYGFESASIPPAEDIAGARGWVRKQHAIGDEETLLFFNGAFKYAPNLQALYTLLDKIDPLLSQKTGFRYRLLICGKDIPAGIDEIRHPHVLLVGFVEDIDVYFKGADVFLNPITEGGGIKTKLVEALGNNLTSVSVRNGAIGIDPAWCNGKLLVCEDHAWEAFANLVIQAKDVKTDTPPLYFEHFYWGMTTKRAAEFIINPPQ